MGIKIYESPVNHSIMIEQDYKGVLRTFCIDNGTIKTIELHLENTEVGDRRSSIVITICSYHYPSDHITIVDEDDELLKVYNIAHKYLKNRYYRELEEN